MMSNGQRQVLILGRQPELSLAELEATFGPQDISPISNVAAIMNTGKVDIDRLGGTIKAAKYLTKLENADFKKSIDYINKEINKHVCCLPPGKLTFGLSVYGLNAKAKEVQKAVFKIKKVIRSEGRSVRVIPNKEPALSSAQVLHNSLTAERGMELLLVKDGKDIILAQTYGVQNIDLYSQRDYERPKRDPYVGMLPPKLAQIMLNLTVQQKAESRKQKPAVLDCFCGTGVVLQEAMLMGYTVIGSDISEKMISYSQENLDWLNNKFNPRGNILQLNVADATSYHWNAPINAVASEMYLGKPQVSEPNKHQLQNLMDENEQLLLKTLKNLHGQLEQDAQLCLAIPAWRQKGKFISVKIVDHLKKLGYTQVRFEHVGANDLVYARKDQIVGRKLLVLKKV